MLQQMGLWVKLLNIVFFFWILGVEKERISISPLLVKEEVERDGTALANQVADSQLSVIMYLIALGFDVICGLDYGSKCVEFAVAKK